MSMLSLEMRDDLGVHYRTDYGDVSIRYGMAVWDPFHHTEFYRDLPMPGLAADKESKGWGMFDDLSAIHPLDEIGAEIKERYLMSGGLKKPG